MRKNVFTFITSEMISNSSYVPDELVDQCKAVSRPATYYTMMLMSCCYVLINTTIGFAMKTIDKTILLSKLTYIITVHLFNFVVMFPFDIKVRLSS